MKETLLAMAAALAIAVWPVPVWAGPPGDAVVSMVPAFTYTPSTVEVTAGAALNFATSTAPPAKAIA